MWSQVWAGWSYPSRLTAADSESSLSTNFWFFFFFFFFFFQNKHLWYVVQLDAAIYGTEENILINSSRSFSFSLTVAMLKSQSACYLVHQRPAIWQPLLPHATHTLSVNYLSNFFTDKLHFKFPLWEQPSVWHVPLDVQLLLSLWAHPKLSVVSRKPYLT